VCEGKGRNGFSHRDPIRHMQIRYLDEMEEDQREVILKRYQVNQEIRESVRNIINNVREEGDVALRRYALEFDNVELEDIDITEKARLAYEDIDEEIKLSIKSAAENIEAFHVRQLREDWIENFDGREMGQRFRAINKIGVYVPGGTASYPSSVLMAVIPAKVAGVGHISMVTPAAKSLNQVTLAAAYIAGVDKIYAAGGAQGIAALAYGTKTIEPVDKIIGPGNHWVATAKKEVRDDVDIEFIAGTSEILIIADSTAKPEIVASDLVAQAEHDVNVAALLVTNSMELSKKVAEEIEIQTELLCRKEIIDQSLSKPYSGIFVANSIEDAAEFAEEYAPEHLSIQTSEKNEKLVLEKIGSAGSIFLGTYAPVAAGDYASGTNHILPTNQGARITGGVSIDTFIKISTIQRLDKEALEKIRNVVTTIAMSEGLDGHAKSIDHRFD
tara:strand:+ start:126 stop:1454 length:1329 start_codon:yes stop_codon:yes gene_type:complete